MKRTIVKIMLFFLRRALIVLSRADSRAAAELAGWPEGYVIVLDASQGVRMALVKQGGKLRKFTGAPPEEQCVLIRFKCMAAVFLLVTAQLGVAEAQAQHRFTLKGDINQAMSVVRCMCLAERYLFPAFLAKKVLRRLDKKEVSSFGIYCRVIFVGR